MATYSLLFIIMPVVKYNNIALLHTAVLTPQKHSEHDCDTLILLLSGAVW